MKAGPRTWPNFRTAGSHGRWPPPVSVIAIYLWQDLGLAGRAETTRLLALHFPALAAGDHAPT